jgi:tetratricopeptide (TPR) repeat protein
MTETGGGVGPDGSSDPRVDISDSKGVAVGGVQFNLFTTAEQPRGPVVAGNVPEVPAAFQPRDELLAHLRDAGSGVSEIRAVTGMRGVGKTQLAAAYARECKRQGWRLIAWVNAEDEQGLLYDLAVVAERLGVSRAGRTLEAIGQEVRNRLEADGERCLIVFDNATDADALRPYVPTIGEPQVVITSTWADLTGPRKPLRVDVFSEGEALTFLAESTERDDPRGARTLADELGHLPLALAQAAAVIRAERLSYPEYLGRLRSAALREQFQRPKGDPYPRGAAEAISLAIDAVTAADSTGLSHGLLGVVSLLSPEGVTRQMLRAAAVAGVFGSASAPADTALGRLADASLLTFSTDASTVTGHRLVLRVVRELAISDGAWAELGTLAIGVLEAYRKEVGEPWRHRLAARDFVRQVMALDGQVTSAPLDPSGTARLLSLRGWALSFLNDLGDSATQAVELGQRLVAVMEQSRGQEHPETLTSRNNLAYAYRDAGRVNDALALFEQVLTTREHIHGHDHPDTLTSRNNLANAYQDAGRLNDALALFEQVLTTREQTLGHDHPSTLNSRNSYAHANRAAGRLNRALPLYEQVLAAREQTLGHDHPSTLNSRNNLAYAYRAGGRLSDALPLYEQTLAASERTLGHDHPSTLNSRNNLAYAYQAAGRLDEAVALYREAISGAERVLGADHPTTVVLHRNLASATRR